MRDVLDEDAVLAALAPIVVELTRERRLLLLDTADAVLELQRRVDSPPSRPVGVDAQDRL